MKRLQLFEFEDFSWFPSWLRVCLTRYIMTIHKMLGSAATIASLLDKLLRDHPQKRILDLCSGSGGPMFEVAKILKSEYGYSDLQLTLCDLYPDSSAINNIQNLGDPMVIYKAHSVDATQIDPQEKGVRTMICSMHHMSPEIARNILKDAQDCHKPMLVYEISDNSFPKWIWWVAIPVNILMVLLITPLVRPLSWQQLVFTYLIPILPLVIAWDGAVSNARTYTLKDLDGLLDGMRRDHYSWEKERIKGKGGPKLYLRGIPE